MAVHLDGADLNLEDILWGADAHLNDAVGGHNWWSSR